MNPNSRSRFVIHSAQLALSLSVDERKDYLASCARQDSELVGEIERLIRSHIRNTDKKAGSSSSSSVATVQRCSETTEVGSSSTGRLSEIDNWFSRTGSAAPSAATVIQRQQTHGRILKLESEMKTVDEHMEYLDLDDETEVQIEDDRETCNARIRDTAAMIAGACCGLVFMATMVVLSIATFTNNASNLELTDAVQELSAKVEQAENSEQLNKPVVRQATLPNWR